MIICSINNYEDQINYIKINYLKDAIAIIKTTDFGKLDDGLFEVYNRDFYYLISTYKTSKSIDEKPAEAHRRYIDLQYIIYGEEKVGYGNYNSNKVLEEEYNRDKDIELFKKVENESFFILKKDMYIIFFPEDIHRPGLSNIEIRGVRKVIFKILIKKKS